MDSTERTSTGGKLVMHIETEMVDTIEALQARVDALVGLGHRIGDILIVRVRDPEADTPIGWLVMWRKDYWNKEFQL
jgi:hypothetical protein